MTWTPELDPAEARPTIRRMTHAECNALLARNNVGRIAFATHGGVDIRPVHYAYEPGWLYGRTAHGAKLAALDRNRWLAFEVDEVRGLLDWASVIVHGSFHRLDPDGPDDEQRAAAARALRLLRAAVPATFAAEGVVDVQTVLFRISMGSVTGRRAVPPKSPGATDSAAPGADVAPPLP